MSDRQRRAAARSAVVVSLGATGQLGRVLRLQDHSGRHSARAASSSGARVERVANFGLRPYEDAQANKRLDLLLELADTVPIPDESTAATMSDDIWRELAAVNQDFRESVKMIPAERRPAVTVLPVRPEPGFRPKIFESRSGTSYRWSGACHPERSEGSGPRRAHATLGPDPRCALGMTKLTGLVAD